MDAVDTSVVVHFLIADDKERFEQAFRLFRRHQLFIPDTVIVETAQQLQHLHGFSAQRIADAFDALFGLPNVHVRDPELLDRAIEAHHHGIDFAEAFHLAHSTDHPRLFTLDPAFAAKAAGMPHRLNDTRVTLP